jgi:hypothetical protein
LFESVFNYADVNQAKPKAPWASQEFERIFLLPRRKLDVTVDLNAELRKPDGTLSLWPVQSVALAEARTSQGLFGAIGVGHGKSLIAALLPTVMDSKCAFLLTEPRLVDQVKEELKTYAEHFHVRLGAIQVISYSTLSVASGQSLFSSYLPDLVVADEGHNLRCRDSVRTRRFLRYFRAYPATRFCVLSGTLASKSILDYEHLIRLALRKGSPLPFKRDELLLWAAALDPVPRPTPGGVLTRFCAPGEAIRVGYRRRLVETAGVVATKKSALGVSLRLYGRRVKLPDVVKQALTDLRTSWTRPDGEEIADAIRFSAIARQLASGFYYRWVWPDGVADQEWLEARAEWFRELRKLLRTAPEGRDSPYLMSLAAARGEITPQSWGAWAAVKGRWKIEEALARRPSDGKPGIVGLEVVWLSDFLVRDVVEWAKQNEPSIIWYRDRCMGPAVAGMGGFPLYGPGSNASRALLGELRNATTRTVVLNQASHGTGKNLVKWSNQLFTYTASSATEWEQNLGRTHRPGQTADAVTATLYRHTSEVCAAFETAMNRARFIAETKGQRMKILFCDKVGF